MRWGLFIIFLALSTHCEFFAMPGAASSGASQGSEDEAVDDENQETEKPLAQAKMPASPASGAEEEQSDTEEVVIESKRLEGFDIIQLENMQDLIKKDNPEIVRLSTEAEEKMREFDHVMSQVVDKVNQHQATYRELSEKRKELYQSIRMSMGGLKELVIEPEQNKAQMHDIVTKSNH